MSRFYVRPQDVRGSEILVSKEEAHHILNVMRLSRGDEVVAFDGTGSEYIGRILSADKKGLRISIRKTNKPDIENKIQVALYQALPKRAKMDFIVEKAAELGAGKIVPLITERTIARVGGKGPKKQARWQNIAISAAKQCGRLDVPRVDPAIKFSDALKELRDYDLAVLACLNENTRPLKEVISDFKGKKVLVMVGPEGDFTPEEIGAAASAGAKLVSLGRLVLRVDTAALHILSVLNYESSPF